MCGRARCSLSPEAILELLKLDTFKDPGQHYKPSYNAAPQSYQPVVLLEKDDNEKRVVMAMKWGLVPSFFAPEKNVNDLRTINARVENLASGGMWKRLVDKRRCVIVSEGYYEWRAIAGQKKKQPFFIHSAGAPLTLLAGLYDVWTPKGYKAKKEEKDSKVKREEKMEEKGERVEKLFSYSVVTTEPTEDIRHIHDRMPLILDTDEKVEKWLHTEKHSFTSIVKDILPSSSKTSSTPLRLEFFEVPSIVGSVQNNGPECCMPLSEWQKKGISPYSCINSFFSVKEEKPTSSSSSQPNPFPVKKEEKEEDNEETSRKRSSPSFSDDDLDKEEEEPSTKKAKTSGSSTAVKRTKCMYGKMCFRKSPLHVKEFAHPGDVDW